MMIHGSSFDLLNTFFEETSTELIKEYAWGMENFMFRYTIFIMCVDDIIMNVLVMLTNMLNKKNDLNTPLSSRQVSTLMP